VTNTDQQITNSPWALPYPVDADGDFVVGRGLYSVNQRASTHPYIEAGTHTVWRSGPFCAPLGHARDADEAVAIIEFDRASHDPCGTCGHWREDHDEQVPDGWIRDRDKTRLRPGVYATCEAFTPAEPGADLPDIAEPYPQASPCKTATALHAVAATENCSPPAPADAFDPPT
jgi:hypothetical protein